MSLNAATIEVLLAKGLTGEDLLEVARAMEVKADRTNAERQARHRAKKKHESNAVTVTGAPPKENKSNPSSASDEAGGEPPDPIKELFDVGVSVLKAAGHTERESRSIVGKWRKSHSDGEVLAALTDCRTKAIANPVEWVPKRLKVRGGSDPPRFLDHYREEQRRTSGIVQ